jgi:hypothetical protein
MMAGDSFPRKNMVEWWETYFCKTNLINPMGKSILLEISKYYCRFIRQHWKEQYIQWGVCGSIYIMELSYHAMLLCLYLGSMNHSPIRCAITLVCLGNRGGFLHQWAFSDCFRGHCEQRSGVERLGGEDAMWIVFGLSIGNTWKMFPKDMSIWGFPEMGGSPK